MKLWNIIDGEPFMVNPRLGIINPGTTHRVHKKGRKTMARRRRRKMTALQRKYFGKKRSPARKRRRTRRNPWTTTGVAINPKRRRRRSVVARSSRRRRSRRNPARSLSIAGFRIPAINKIIFAGVGFIGPPIVEGFLSGFVPASFSASQPMLTKYGIKVLSVVGLTFAVRQFVGADEANMTAIGGSVYIVSSLISDFAPGAIPGLSAYVSNGIGAYTSGTSRNFNTMGEFPGAIAFPVDTVNQAVASRFKRY